MLKCNNQSEAIKAVVISFQSHWVMKKYVYMLLMGEFSLGGYFLMTSWLFEFKL